MTTKENFDKITKYAKDITHTEKAKHFMKGYYKSHLDSIGKCCKTPSTTKNIEEIYMLEKILSLNGDISNYKIISFNKMYFTCGYTLTVEHNDIYITYLIIETVLNTYIIDTSKYNNL